MQRGKIHSWPDAGVLIHPAFERRNALCLRSEIGELFEGCKHGYR